MSEVGKINIIIVIHIRPLSVLHNNYYVPSGQTISATQPPDTRAKAVLNPSNIMISQKRPDGVSAQNCLKGTITGMTVEKESGAIRIDVAVSGIPFICSVTHHAAETLKLLPGKEVWVVFKASSLHWQ